MNIKGILAAGQKVILVIPIEGENANSMLTSAQHQLSSTQPPKLGFENVIGLKIVHINIHILFHYL